MNTQEALLTRRTVHHFKPDLLPAGALEQALEAAIRAPNHKLTNPWRFTEVGAPSRRAFVDVASDLKFGPGYTESQRAMLAKKMETSPVFLIVSQVLNPDANRRKEDYAAVACAIENFSLSLWARGIGTKWSTTKAIHDARVYELMGIDSAVEEIVGVLFVGFPAVVPETPRRPVSEVFRRVD